MFHETPLNLSLILIGIRTESGYENASKIEARKLQTHLVPVCNKYIRLQKLGLNYAKLSRSCPEHFTV
jgi:hypothetical protein